MAGVVNVPAAVVAFLVLTLAQDFVNGFPEHSGRPPAYQEEPAADDERETAPVPLLPLPNQPAPVGLQQSRAAGRRGPVWQQLSLHPICFYAKGRRPGELTWIGAPVQVGALALVHKSGFVRCAQQEEYNSYWGCYHKSSLVQNPLNVVVTDLHGNLIFPQEKYIRNRGLWYYLPGTDPLHSKVLMFSDYQSPLYLRTNQRLRIWYGEDLRNWSSGDNSGRVCVDVVGYVMPTFSTTSVG